MGQPKNYFGYIFLSVILINCIAEKIVFLNMEHPKVVYYNPAFLKYANLTTIRYGRKNPIYYVGLNFDTYIPFDTNVYIDVYFYELLTNVYKRSFIEFHFNWCYLIEKDLFFGYALRTAGIPPCPNAPGAYNLNNMTVNPAFIPKGFPFTKGRIWANFSQAKTKARIAEGYINIKLSEIEKKMAKF